MDSINLILLVLLLLCVFCLGCGLGMASQERHARRQKLPGTPEPGDEEIMIFDRVTFGLSRLPPIEEPQALEKAQTDVMCHIAQEYGLTTATVEAIYRRVWHRTHVASAP